MQIARRNTIWMPSTSIFEFPPPTCNGVASDGIAYAALPDRLNDSDDGQVECHFTMLSGWTSSHCA